jgi:hypothetical protein
MFSELVVPVLGAELGYKRVPGVRQVRQAAAAEELWTRPVAPD